MKNVALALVAIFAAIPAFAQEAAAASHMSGGMIGLAAALAISIAAVGGALGQGRAVSSALEGISRNPAAQPKIFVPMIIGLALIESLVIYAFVIAFILVGKV